MDSMKFGSPKFVACSRAEQQGFDTYLVTGETTGYRPPPTPLPLREGRKEEII
jgi:hypothetical protein